MKFSLRIPLGTKNGLYILLGEGFARSLMVLGMLLAARFVGPSMYGHYGILWAEMQIAWSIIEFGTTMAGTRDLAKALQDGSEGEVISGILYLRLLLWSIVIASWGGMAFLLRSTGSQPTSMEFLALSMCLLAMVFSSDWMLRAAERFIQLGIAQSVSVTIYVVIVILFAHLYPAVQSLLWAHVLQALMVAGMQWRMLPPNLLRIKFAPLSISLLTRYVGRGGFFAVTGALYQGAITGFLWGTGKIFGNHVLGLTTALMRIYQLINAGSFMLAVGYFPRLAREHCKSEVNSLRRLMGFSGVLFALLFPLIIVPIAGLVLGSSFREINFLAYGASLGLFFGAMRYVYSIPLAAQIRHWEAVVANSLYFLIALCAPFLLAQWLSFEWVSLSISMAELMAFFGMLISIKLLGKGNA